MKRVPYSGCKYPDSMNRHMIEARNMMLLRWAVASGSAWRFTVRLDA